MMQAVKTLKKVIQKDKLFVEYAKILNGVLQLPPRELEVLSFLLTLDYSSKITNVSAKEIRSSIMSTLKINNANLSKYFRVLKDYGLLVKGQSGKWVLNDVLKPDLANNVVELKYMLVLNE